MCVPPHVLCLSSNTYLHAYQCVLDVLSHPACIYPTESIKCAGESAQHIQFTSLWTEQSVQLAAP